MQPASDRVTSAPQAASMVFFMVFSLVSVDVNQRPGGTFVCCA
jgi:hypothetical protein